MSKDVCKGCETPFKKKSSTGYCAKCFHKNVDQVKSLYNKKRWDSGAAKVSHWKFRGVVFTEADIEEFNNLTNCEICKESFKKVRKCLDHCHDTGIYRGALCVQCNAALGNLGDNLDLVISRLTRYRDKVKW